jgi:hypothetical protein
MHHERGEDLSKDKFYKRGQKYQKKQRHLERRWQRVQQENMANIEGALDADDDIELLQGKIKREALKEELFEYMNF